MTGPRILVYDVERVPNVGDFWAFWKQNISPVQVHERSRTVSWAAKWAGEDKVQFKSEHHHGHEKMARGIIELFDEADWVVTFNGDKFDNKHVNNLIEQYQIPRPSPFTSIDLLKVVKKNFAFESNRLSEVLDRFGLAPKLQHTGHELWLDIRGYNGEAAKRKGWALMKRYNMQDVDSTEELFERLRRWINLPHIGMYDAEGEALGCPQCSSTDVQRRGYRYTPGFAYPKFVCNNCGKWSTSAKSVSRSEFRSF